MEVVSSIVRKTTEAEGPMSTVVDQENGLLRSGRHSSAPKEHDSSLWAYVSIILCYIHMKTLLFVSLRNRFAGWSFPVFKTKELSNASTQTDSPQTGETRVAFTQTVTSEYANASVQTVTLVAKTVAAQTVTSATNTAAAQTDATHCHVVAVQTDATPCRTNTVQTDVQTYNAAAVQTDAHACTTTVTVQTDSTAIYDTVAVPARFCTAFRGTVAGQTNDPDDFQMTYNTFSQTDSAAFCETVAVQTDSPALACEAVAAQTDSPALACEAVAAQTDSPALACEAVAAQTDSPALACEAVAAQTDSPALACEAVACQTDSPALACEAVACQTDSPALACEAVACQTDSPALACEAVACQTDSSALACKAVPYQTDSPALACETVACQTDSPSPACETIAVKTDSAPRDDCGDNKKRSCRRTGVAAKRTVPYRAASKDSVGVQTDEPACATVLQTPKKNNSIDAVNELSEKFGCNDPKAIANNKKIVNLKAMLKKIELNGFKSLNYRELLFTHQKIIENSAILCNRYQSLIEIAVKHLPSWHRGSIKQRHDIVHIFATLEKVLDLKNKEIDRQKFNLTVENDRRIYAQQLCITKNQLLSEAETNYERLLAKNKTLMQSGCRHSKSNRNSDLSQCVQQWSNSRFTYEEIIAGKFLRSPVIKDTVIKDTIINDTINNDTIMKDTVNKESSTDK